LFVYLNLSTNQMHAIGAAQAVQAMTDEHKIDANEHTKTAK